MPTTARLLCPELVGRQAESALIEHTRDEALAGRGRLLLVAADAGVGKTALLRHFTERTRSAGVRVLWGDCSVTDARRPYAPFVDALRSGKHSSPPSTVEETLRNAGAPLSRLLPELVSQEPLADAATQRRLQERLWLALADLARRAPLVVVLEDIHWADDATLEALLFIAHRIRDTPVLLIGTYRSDELQRRHPLRRVLSELRRSRLSDEVRLSPLSRTDTSVMIRATVGLEPPRDLVDAVHRLCEGNPFFVEEVLMDLAERGDLTLHGDRWKYKSGGGFTVPGSLREAVLARVEPLSDPVLHTLQIAAVIGRRCDFVLLQRVTGASERDLLGDLRVLIDAQLLQERAGAADVYEYRHALTREAVLDDLLLRERRSLHQAIGEALEVLPGTDGRIEELAYHFGEARDASRAVRYHERAGDEAREMFAFRRAMEHYEHAIDLASVEGPALATLELKLSGVAALAFDWRRQQQAAKTAVTLLGNAQDLRRVLALTSIGWARSLLGDHEGARTVHADAIRVAEELSALIPASERAEIGAGSAADRSIAASDPQLTLAEAYHNAAVTEYYGGNDLVAAARLATRAVEAARASADRHLLPQTLCTLGQFRTAAGDPSGLRLIREALTVAREMASAPDLVRAHGYLSESLRASGARASEWLGSWEDGAKVAATTGFRNWSFVIASMDLALARGDWDDALEFALEFAGSGAKPDALAHLRREFIEIARMGPAHHPLTIRISGRSSGVRTGPSGQDPFAAVVAWLAGDSEETLAVAERIKPQAQFGEPGSENLALTCAVLAAAGLAQPVARVWCERGERAADRALEPYVARACRAVARGERAVFDGDFALACTQLSEAARVLHDEQAPHVETFVRLRLGELLLAQGDRAGAASQLVAVLPYWRRARATWYLGELRRWAAARKLPFDDETAPPARHAAGLTRREREVAALVAEGLTNRQIAERLVLSERTVESHLEQVRSKLGASNRAQVAAWAGEQGLSQKV